jgi:hypothetical protein
LTVSDQNHLSAAGGKLSRDPPTNAAASSCDKDCLGREFVCMMLRRDQGVRIVAKGQRRGSSEEIRLGSRHCDCFEKMQRKKTSEMFEDS